MHRGVDHHRGGELLSQSADRFLTAVRGAVVDGPEHPVRGLVGLLGHDLFDQSGERSDPRGVLAPAEDLRAVHVVRGEIGHRNAAVVVVVDPHHSVFSRREGGVAAAAGLDGGLLRWPR